MPNVSLRVAVWTVNTFTAESNAFSGVNLLGRLAALDEAVGLAKGYFDGFKAEVMRIFDAPGPSLDIFIAPEYLFTRAPEQHMVSEDEVITMEHRCRTMSQGILLIPGTISWRKPLDRSQDRFSQANDAERLSRVGKQYAHTRLEKANRRLEVDRQMQNVLVSRQYEAEKLEEELGKVKAGVESKKTALAFSSVIGGGYVARNTAFVFRDGRRVMKYHKRGDFTEVTANDHTGGDSVVFIPGEADGFFSLTQPRLDCGIEVCGDHSLGYLANSALKRIPDIHFLCSAFVLPRAEHIRVKPGGCLIHASSWDYVSGVYRDPNLYDRLEPDRRIGVSKGGELYCYDVTIDTKSV